MFSWTLHHKDVLFKPIIHNPTSFCIKAMQKLITANKQTSDQKLNYIKTKSLVQKKGIPLSWVIS